MNIYTKCGNSDLNILKLQKSVEDINTKKIKLLDLNIDGYITKDEFIRKNCEYNKKINEINKSINNLLKIEDSKLSKYIRDMLFGCVEFTQLNISQDKWDKGMRDPFCKENSSFSFTAVGHDKDGVPYEITQSKDYFDFIDLDACVQNITHEIYLNEQNSDDCFLCKYAKEYKSMEPSDTETCKTCTLNPNYRFKREPHPMSLVPRNSPEYIKFMEELNKKNSQRQRGS